MTIYWTDADVSHLSQMSHLHFFQFFLRKNLEKVKCLTYLCIGFRKEVRLTARYRLVSLS